MFFNLELQNFEKFVICHNLNIKNIDEEFKRSTTFKHNRNFIHKTNSRFMNIIELKNTLNLKKIDIKNAFNFIAQ